MASQEVIPSLAELQDAFFAEAAAERTVVDGHDGSLFDHMAGPGALVVRRLMERDRQGFQKLYLNGGTGDALTDRVFRLYGRERVLDTQGEGEATLRRASDAAGGGTIWKGTRIGVGLPGNTALAYYEVATDTAVALALEVPVPIKSVKTGPDVALDVNVGQIPVLRIEDPLWDPSWEVTTLVCDPGTKREEDADLIANLQQERFDSRPGYQRSLDDRLIEIGAKIRAFFPSNRFGDDDDHGLNRIAVGDAGAGTPPALLAAARMVAREVGIAGTSIQIYPIQPVDLGLYIELQFFDPPAGFDVNGARLDALQAAVSYFEDLEGAFLWNIDAITARVQKAVRNLHHVGMTPTLAPPFPSTVFTYPMSYYKLKPWNVKVVAVTPT